MARATRPSANFRTALNLYTSANNKQGIAAAHKELGDLYLRQGQDKTALDHYNRAHESLTGVLTKEQRDAAASGAAARMVDSKAATVADTAAGARDSSFNAKLLLAKIGDTNYRLGRMTEAATAYSRMDPKKPESAAKKAGGMFGKLASGIAIGSATDSIALGSAAEAVGSALVVKKELDQYRTAIVYMTYEVGMGRIAFSNNDLLTAQTHFKNAAEAGKSALPMIANLGQTRRFRAAARTSLADVVWRQGNYKEASQAIRTGRKRSKGRQTTRLNVAGAART